MTVKSDYRFVQDSRMGIKIPMFDKDWDKYSIEEQSDIIKEWEHERAKIPDRIKQLEGNLIEIQDLMSDKDFEEYCQLHKKVIAMASIISDLNIWYRVEGEITKIVK